MEKRETKHGALLTAIFSIISVSLYVPHPAGSDELLQEEGIHQPQSLLPSPLEKCMWDWTTISAASNRQTFLKVPNGALVITVGSVFLILLCTSMCAWYIVRVKNALLPSAIYYLCLFAMIVPFQMEMFTLSKLANTLKLNTPWGLWIIYLGFGAGLAVFMFTGFVKSIPLEIEEAAMIDGCNPLQTFFGVVLPIMKPTCVTVAILQTMWIWNDYLLPYLVLDLKKYTTIPIAVQYLKGGYGSVDMGAMMGVLVLAIIPYYCVLSFLPEIYY